MILNLQSEFQSLLICFVSKLIPTVANLADKFAQVELTVIGEQNS